MVMNFTIHIYPIRVMLQTKNVFVVFEKKLKVQNCYRTTYHGRRMTTNENQFAVDKINVSRYRF